MHDPCKHIKNNPGSSWITGPQRLGRAALLRAQKGTPRNAAPLVLPDPPPPKPSLAWAWPRRGGLEGTEPKELIGARPPAGLCLPI